MAGVAEGRFGASWSAARCARVEDLEYRARPGAPSGFFYERGWALNGGSCLKSARSVSRRRSCWARESCSPRVLGYVCRPSRSNLSATCGHALLRRLHGAFGCGDSPPGPDRRCSQRAWVHPVPLALLGRTRPLPSTPCHGRSRPLTFDVLLGLSGLSVGRLRRATSSHGSGPGRGDRKRPGGLVLGPWLRALAPALRGSAVVAVNPAAMYLALGRAGVSPPLLVGGSRTGGGPMGVVFSIVSRRSW